MRFSGGVDIKPVASLLVGVLALGCVIPVANSPSDAVRRALEGIVAHDLAGASLAVCAERRDPRDFPFLIGGIFQPVGALPGGDIGRTLSVIELDASRVTIQEKSRERDSAVVEVEGVLVERLDPTEVEALFRDYAAESGQPLEMDLLQETLANVSHGDVTLPVREEVRVVLEGGTWKVCPLAPTP